MVHFAAVLAPVVKAGARRWVGDAPEDAAARKSFCKLPSSVTVTVALVATAGGR